MKYYQVQGDPCNWATNELFTLKEMEKLSYAPPKKICRLVEINKNHTYWFFGARFPYDDAEITIVEAN